MVKRVAMAKLSNIIRRVLAASGMAQAMIKVSFEYSSTVEENDVFMG